MCVCVCEANCFFSLIKELTSLSPPAAASVRPLIIVIIVFLILTMNSTIPQIVPHPGFAGISPAALAQLQAGTAASGPAPGTFGALFVGRPARTVPPPRVSLSTGPAASPHAVLEWLNAKIGSITFSIDTAIPQIRRLGRVITSLIITPPPPGVTADDAADAVLTAAYVALAAEKGAQDAYLTIPRGHHFAHLDPNTAPPSGYLILRRRSIVDRAGNTRFLKPTHRAQWVADVVRFIQLQHPRAPLPTHILHTAGNSLALAYSAADTRDTITLLHSHGVAVELIQPAADTVEITASFPTSADPTEAAHTLITTVGFIAASIPGAMVDTACTSRAEPTITTRFTLGIRIRCPPGAIPAGSTMCDGVTYTATVAPPTIATSTPSASTTTTGKRNNKKKK